MDQTIEVTVPDIGDYKDVPIIEIPVKAGDIVTVEQSLITLESDKATIDVPSPLAGKIKTLLVKAGDLVSAGSPILLLETAAANLPEQEQGVAQPAPQSAADPTQDNTTDLASSPSAQGQKQDEHSVAAEVTEVTPDAPLKTEGFDKTASFGKTEGFDKNALAEAPLIPLPEHTTVSHASPAVRKLARELGVDVQHITGSGPKGRITQNDLYSYIKNQSGKGDRPKQKSNDDIGLKLLPWPDVDFGKFGPVQTQALSRIQQITSANLHRNWVSMPHVTHQQAADITALEALCGQLNQEYQKTGVKVTLLAFLIKAVAVALKQHPHFNASLADAAGTALILKQYYNIGFAADTPQGLVVPVITACDQKGVLDIAAAVAELASRARAGKLRPEEMQGGTFSISSLGGIGGGYFTPIINAPEVAILGVGRSSIHPVWDGAQFVPQSMLPLSLSYDHRVINGAQAARFSVTLAQLLADFRRAVL
jgi:pyruvate dehydrogenase E2 component (dihydrolipoamide acetyltransferase)